MIGTDTAQHCAWATSVHSASTPTRVFAGELADIRQRMCNGLYSVHATTARRATLRMALSVSDTKGDGAVRVPWDIAYATDTPHAKIRHVKDMHASFVAMVLGAAADSSADLEIEISRGTARAYSAAYATVAECIGDAEVRPFVENALALAFALQRVVSIKTIDFRLLALLHRGIAIGTATPDAFKPVLLSLRYLHLDVDSASDGTISAFRLSALAPRLEMLTVHGPGATQFLNIAADGALIRSLYLDNSNDSKLCPVVPRTVKGMTITNLAFMADGYMDDCTWSFSGVEELRIIGGWHGDTTARTPNERGREGRSGTPKRVEPATVRVAYLACAIGHLVSIRTTPKLSILHIDGACDSLYSLCVALPRRCIQHLSVSIRSSVTGALRPVDWISTARALRSVTRGPGMVFGARSVHIYSAHPSVTGSNAKVYPDFGFTVASAMFQAASDIVLVVHSSSVPAANTCRSTVLDDLIAFLTAATAGRRGVVSCSIKNA